MNTEKPVLIFQFSEELKKPIPLNGEGEKAEFNHITYLKFKGDWWLVKLEIRKKKQSYASLVLFVDMLGNTKFSQDNIFSIPEKNAKKLIKKITKYINIYKKENL